ncbi:MAG TPA: hypothetical protein PLE19_15610 [Planctomycetota bacterium]|nr:hypothetical protein [Planctomycetota bacterium]HRR79933.1 hypothetical protein [Planctomycetota bacterium]
MNAQRSLACSFALFVLVPRAWGGEVASIEVRNLSGQALENVPVTFGLVLRKDEAPKGQALETAQADVKRLYDDGSARFAIVSAMLPSLPANGSAPIALTAGPARQDPPPKPVMLDELLKTDFDAVVILTFPDGMVRSASARAMLQAAGQDAKTWLQGPVVTEWLVSGPPADKEGKPDDDLNVQFQVRAYAGCKRVRVSVVVENCWDTWAGNIRYDAAVTVGGKEVFAAKAVDHRRLARWRRVFWWGGEAPPIHIVHDVHHLTSTGALPNYDLTLPPLPPDWQMKRDLSLEGPRWEIMGHGSLTAYMPTTGGRPEIGPYPAWAVQYLLHKDPRACDLVLANGDLAGSWPIHVRARKTGRIMTIDDRPDFWLDERGKDKPAWRPDRTPPDPKQSKLSPDLAHQGSFAYIPYLLTGDFYYLEEAFFWANYCLLATWPSPRWGAKGIIADQIRGDAWALRNIADAAWIAPTDAPEGRYLDEKLRNNIADRICRMYGPPEFSKLGFWGPRTVQDARIQNPANPDWIITAPWEHDYFIWSFHHMVELGWPDAAKVRDYQLRWRVGTLTNAPDFDPMLASPYRMVVGEKGPDGKPRFYEDWKKLGEENARLSKPGLTSYGGGYSYSARAAVICGVDGGFPKAREALAWLDANLTKPRDAMARDPLWAILPRTALLPRP